MRLDPFEPVQVVGDADRLKQLLLILLDNALKYTPAGARVTRRDAHTRPRLWFRMRCGDRGDGSAARVRALLSRRPARNRDAGGTAGLAIARWIVEQHHGTIQIDSALDQGTTVTVSLPIQS